MGLAGLLRDDGHGLLDFARPALVPEFTALGEVGLLVTDYEMPDQNGFELADAFHAAHPQTPVIVITGLHSRIVEIEAARRDFVHLIFKPVDYDDLHALIHRVAR
jgi:DNA-binding NtrC family response regulator